ncbi:MAG: flavin reductase family protein [Pseudomonadota bacterium]|nr:flavin reductase family protein [Pseudomonadota bacterium]
MDARALRDVFGQFCTGVTAVCTTDASGNSYGITVNSFSSLSLDPPLAMFAIVRDSDTLKPLRESGHFCINILGASQQEVSNRLAKKGGPEKMAQIPTRVARTGAPVIADAVAYLDCSLYELYEGGDHLIVVGEIQEAKVLSDEAPLLYFRSAYRSVQD